MTQAVWKFLDRKTIERSDGHKIELEEGNWYSPLSVNPTFTPGTSAIDCAHIVRDGLAFAERTPCKAPKAVAKPAVRKKHTNRKVLSLKKSH